MDPGRDPDRHRERPDAPAPLGGGEPRQSTLGGTR
jgi:hypothetical protein